MRQISVFSLDYDDCTAPVGHPGQLDIVSCNRQLLQRLKKWRGNSNFVFNGSERQSYSADCLGLAAHNNGYCLELIPQLAGSLGAEFNPLLLADIYRHLEYGASYALFNDRHSDHEDAVEHADWTADHSMLSIVYAQMHAIAIENPEVEIAFYFLLGSEAVCEILHDYFSDSGNEGPSLIPNNMQLYLCQYRNSELVRLQHSGTHEIFRELDPIVGLGEIDEDYAATILWMTKEANRDNIYNTVDIAKYVPPYMILAERLASNYQVMHYDIDGDNSDNEDHYDIGDDQLITASSSVASSVEAKKESSCSHLRLFVAQHPRAISSGAGSGMLFGGGFVVADYFFKLGMLAAAASPVGWALIVLGVAVLIAMRIMHTCSVQEKLPLSPGC